jgi:WD40 repeat protein
VASHYSPFLDRERGHNNPSIDMIDVDCDGDDDRVSSLGDNGRLIWQETLANGRGPIRTLSQMLRYAPIKFMNESSGFAWAQLTGRDETIQLVERSALQRIEISGIPSQDFAVPLLDDLDGDGRPEVLFVENTDRFCHLHSVAENAQYATKVVGKRYQSVVGFDVDEDGSKDVLVADAEAGTIQWHPQEEKLRFGNPQRLVSGLDRPELLDLQDVDDDGKADLITSDQGTVVWLKRESKTSFGAPTPVRRPIDELRHLHRFRQLAIWDTESGNRVRSINTLQTVTRVVAFSPDDTRIAVGGNGRTLRLLGLRDGKHLMAKPMPDYRIEALAFSPSGDQLAVGHGDAARILDTRTWEDAARPLEHGNTVNQLLWVDSGRKLVTAGHDLRVRVWDSSQGQLIHDLTEVEARVTTLAASRDGTTLAVGTRSGTLDLWDLESGQLLVQMRDPSSSVLSAAFTEYELICVVRIGPENKLIRRRILAPDVTASP